MLHKIFQWWYLKTRSSTYSSKFESRIRRRNVIFYHDFRGDGMNSKVLWLYRIAFKTIFGTVPTAAVWSPTATTV